MTDIEAKALALVNEVNVERGYAPYSKFDRDFDHTSEALCRSIEQHEAFKQEVSDVASVCVEHFCKNSWTVGDRQDHINMLDRFIIPKPKPDPLVEIMNDMGFPILADKLRAALEARGLEIRSKNDE